MTLRSFLFWPHLIAGLLAGVVILVMSVTGVLLTYERQLIAWSDSHYRSAPPSPGAAPMPLETLLARVRLARPDASSPTAVIVRPAADAPVALTVDGTTLYVDAFTGAVLGESTQGVRQFMSDLRSWHRWLAMEGDNRDVARAVTGWANVLFALLALTGLYLWLPRTWSRSSVRAVALFNRKATGKARDFNWHNVIGMWTAVPLLIVVVSAIPISFPWATAAVYRAYGEEPPAPRGGAPGGRRGGGPGEGARQRAEPQTSRSGLEPTTVSVTPLTLDALLFSAQREVPDWQSISLRLPASPADAVVLSIDTGDGGQPHLRSTMTLNQETGALEGHETFASQSPARRMRSIMRFAHTGEVLGLPGQTVAGLVTLGSIVLVWTGFALAWRRCRAWVGRRARHGAYGAYGGNGFTTEERRTGGERREWIGS